MNKQHLYVMVFGFIIILFAMELNEIKLVNPFPSTEKYIERIVNHEKPSQGLKTLNKCKNIKYFYNNMHICKALIDYPSAEEILQSREAQESLENQWAHTGHNNDN